MEAAKSNAPPIRPARAAFVLIRRLLLDARKEVSAAIRSIVARIMLAATASLGPLALHLVLTTLDVQIARRTRNVR